MNRAFDGDIVAIEILPESEWSGESEVLPGNSGKENEESHASAGAEVAQVCLNSLSPM